MALSGTVSLKVRLGRFGARAQENPQGPTHLQHKFLRLGSVVQPHRKWHNQAQRQKCRMLPLVYKGAQISGRRRCTSGQFLELCWCPLWCYLSPKTSTQIFLPGFQERSSLLGWLIKVSQAVSCPLHYRLVLPVYFNPKL